MANRQPKEPGRVRPNIRISHTLNGRVRDYAERNGMTAEEAYREIIERGLEELEGDD